jgi:HAD superfamily hydrolase (TIGR01509 family)
MSGAGRKGPACIFDLDGTLIDSEPNYYEADKAFVAEYGIVFDEAFRDQMIGRGSLAFFSVIEERWPDKPLNLLPMEQRLFLKDEAYLEYARGRTFAFPQMLRLLDLLSGSGHPMAVASGSSPEVIRKTMEYAGIRDRFTHLVSAQEVPKGKPEPDVFLEAARRLGHAPEDCVVFEDSQYGVLAAQAAGMRIVGIPSLLSGPLPRPFRSVDLLFEKGMGEFDADKAFAFVWSL